MEREFPDKDHAMLWVLKNQLGRRNLNNYQFDLLVGQEYELEKRLEGRPRITEEKESNTKLAQSGLVISEPKPTAEKIAEEHGISEKTVKRSADLFRSHQAIKEAAPEIAPYDHFYKYH